MKVVALHTDFRIYWPARLKHLSEKLQERGDELFVVEIAGKGSNYAFADHNKDNFIHWICLYPNDRIEDINPSVAKKTVIAKLNELNPDVVLSGAFAFTSGATAIDWTKSNNKAVVMFDDAKKENLQRNFITNVIKRIFYSYIDSVLCPSKDWNDTYKSWGIPSNAIFYGVDVVDNLFWNRGKKLTIDCVLPEKYFLCVGRQISCKNFDIVIEAFKQVATQEAEFDLVFVGAGEESDKLRSLAGELYENKIHFIPFQSPENLSVIYQKAYCFILPSLSETWGLVVNEAMASGLPVIVSQYCGCVNTLVINGKNGFVFSPGHVEELASYMKKIICLSSEEMNKMKEKSLQIINDWGLDCFSSGAIEAIDYAIKNKRKPFYFLGKYLLKKWNGRYNPI